MLSEDQLGEALTERLEDLVAAIDPSAALHERVQQIPGPPRGRLARLAARPHRRILAISIPVTAAAAAVVALLLAAAAPPSFAVTQSTDGVIVVTIRQITGLIGAQAKLRSLHAPVAIVPITKTCQSRVPLSYMAVGAVSAGATIRITPSQIPANTTLVLAAKQIPDSRIEIAVGRVSGPPPTCAAPGQTGPGLTNATPTPASTPSTPTTASTPNISATPASQQTR
ncbi:MAG: hypothetical protein ACP5H2_01935 [Solirubrobacteraceae bacterium]